MSDVNGREGSEAPSSSSDFYNTDAQEAQSSHVLPSNTLSPMEQEQPSAPTQDADDADDEGSSSEMDVSASSRASSPEADHNPAAQQTGAKRKLTDASDGSATLNGDDKIKKRKLSPTPMEDSQRNGHKHAGLPPEIWQQVFLYLSPAMLCRCLRVSREFNDALTKIKAGPVAKKGQPRARAIDSDAIWTNARKGFLPNLPRPLVRCTELEMLQLIGGRSCQFCGIEPVPPPATTPFNCGPGPDGVRVIWPFGIRTCGNCIVNKTIRDVQVLVSNAAALRAGLPYSFLTPDLHFVPEIQRQAPGGIPSHLRVAKVYFVDDLASIVDECESAKSFGEGAADEWRKGLHLKGKEAMADAARWEKWEAQMRLGIDLVQVLREYDPSSFPKYNEEIYRRSVGSAGPQSGAVTNGTHTLPQPVHTFQNAYGMPFPVPAQNLQFQQAHRPVRDPHEVDAMRQQRKADIERRCMELEPPLEPSVLQHIDSFQAAMQITAPLTDSAWEMLRPRLLAQREAAELLEHQRQEQWAALQATVPFTAAEEAFIKPAKELYDKEYEHAQEPLRKRLGEYADEYIKDHWNGANALDKDNSPTFAVETMLWVRQRYLSDKDAGAIPSYDVPVRSGSKQGTPIPEPFLSLDNMKWVYDNKIRILTDHHRRELFICAGCAEERKPKWFAFEGLIQHYGAKHTTAFSKGNIVVHWQTSEWPEDPPFHRHPSSFIKTERNFEKNFKNHGRPRNTPQASHDGPFAPPKLLSENPFFSSQASPPSNGYYNASNGHQAHSYGQGSPYMAPRGPAYSPVVPAEPSIDMSMHAQVNKVSSDAREIWDALEGVKELLECVRIQAVIHHVVSQFEKRFRQKLNLDLVTDALATGGDLIKPVKNANGLACRICVASQTDGSANYQSYFARIRNVKLFNASSLITHFKIRHQDSKDTRDLDWTKDMLELPELQIISDLIRTPGMDDAKLEVLAAAFPTAFPWPLPKIGVVEEPPPDLGPDSGLANRLIGRLTKKSKNQQKSSKKGQNGTNGISTPGREASEPLPEPKEDEYDPRRPMYLMSSPLSADPARFDTDIARKSASAMSPMSSSTISLAPETLAALNNLNALAINQKDQTDTSRGDRSPSVGRAESMSSLGQPAQATPKPAPDISAILASLTGQPPPQSQSQASRNATPPTTVSNRSDSAPKHPHADPYGQPIDPARRSYQDDRRAASHYPTHAASYRSSLEPSPRFAGQDIVAASSRNAESFDHNRARPYIEPTYIQAQPTHHSPTRYRYVYEEGAQQYAQPMQAAPVYREQPVQYIQLPPEHERPPTSGYQYERPAPKPMYVDEYGRQIELIPIDSAPAPVQYVPHPFEQQQQRQQHYAQPASASRPHAAQPVYYEYGGGPPPGSSHGAHGMY